MEWYHSACVLRNSLPHSIFGQAICELQILTEQTRKKFRGFTANKRLKLSIWTDKNLDRINVNNLANVRIAQIYRKNAHKFSDANVRCELKRNIQIYLFSVVRAYRSYRSMTTNLSFKSFMRQSSAFVRRSTTVSFLKRIKLPGSTFFLSKVFVSSMFS